MKNTIVLLLCLVYGVAFGHNPVEKEVETEVREVTVFIDKAQITRQKAVEVPEGISLLKFIKLSPFIEGKSIQVKANGNVTVLAVNHQQNFLDKPEKSEGVNSLESKIESVNDEIKLEETYLSILQEELVFLYENRVIGGKNNEVSVSTLRQASEFYGAQLKALKLKEIERNQTLRDLHIKRRELQNQLNSLTSKVDFASGEILVKVQSKSKTNATFDLTYLVGNAGWHPTYDIRATNVNEPLEIVYKANLRQDTKVDWKNVKLTFSSSNPNSSGIAPELQPYYLDYYSLPPSYNASINAVSGRVLDSENGPLPGVTVTVPETTIGVVTDINGNYSITLPNNAGYLSFSFIGFEDQVLPITGSVINVRMVEDEVNLDEVVVVGYGSQQKSDEIPRQMAISAEKQIKIRGTKRVAIPLQKSENQTAVSFEITAPYSVSSDNKTYTVDMTVYQVPVFFQYYAVPKIEKNAYLLANITDWAKYSLLEGEANIFFEETFMGKTLLDVRFAGDTLQLSMGKDKNVVVDRQKMKDFETRQFIGSKKEETKSWKTTVRNNKNQEINMVIFDQVPVSKVSDIEVDVQKLSGGKLNSENGTVKWEFSLQPNENKEFDLKYSVKYPKSRQIVLE